MLSDSCPRILKFLSVVLFPHFLNTSKEWSYKVFEFLACRLKIHPRPSLVSAWSLLLSGGIFVDVGGVNYLGRKDLWFYLWSFYHSLPLIKRSPSLTLTAKDRREYNPPFTCYHLDPSSKYSHTSRYFKEVLNIRFF